MNLTSQFGACLVWCEGDSVQNLARLTASTASCPLHRLWASWGLFLGGSGSALNDLSKSKVDPLRFSTSRHGEERILIGATRSRTPRRQFRGAVPRKDPNASGLHPDFIGFDRTSGQIQKKKDEERKEEQHYKNTWKRAGGVNRMANPSLRGQVLPSTS